jgi:hypothetical protein
MSYTYFEDIIFEFPVINSDMEAAILVFHLTPMTSHLTIARLFLYMHALTIRAMAGLVALQC